MARHGALVRFTTAFAAGSMLLSSAASAAPQVVDPLVALSVFGTQESRSAVCAAGSAAAAAAGAAAAGQAGAAPGCVLPAVDAPAPVAVVEPAPVAVIPPVAAGSGIAVLPLLLGLATIAAVAAVLFKGGGNNNDEIVIPISA